MSVNEKLTAIANNIRYYAGTSAPYSLDGMASGVVEAYDSGNRLGYNRGFEEGAVSGHEEGFLTGYEKGYAAGKSGAAYDPYA